MRRVGIMAAAVIFVAGAVMGCDNKSQPPVVGHANRADSADQVMYKARFNLTDNGLSRAELTADSALFFDDNTRVELQNVAATFFTITGARDAYLTSKRGTYMNRLGNMMARDSVIVVTEEGRLDTAAMRPVARMGYDEYAVVEWAFRMTRPGADVLPAVK